VGVLSQFHFISYDIARLENNVMTLTIKTDLIEFKYLTQLNTGALFFFYFFSTFSDIVLFVI